jgi:hypothetical protein
MRLAEEGGAFVRVVTELMAEDAESAGGVAETAGDVSGSLLLNEVGAEGLILALQRELRREEELLVGRGRYLIGSAGLHIPIVLQNHLFVNMFKTVGEDNVETEANYRVWRYTGGEGRKGGMLARLTR